MHRRVQRLMAAVFAFNFLVTYLIAPVQSALASPAAAPGAPPAAPMPAARPAAAPSAPMNLDLTSTARTLPAPQFVQNRAVNILVGGATQSVTPQTLMTPAERLAAFQVFSTGHQSLLVDSLGNATGGSFAMGAKFSQYISSLVVPQGVTAVRDFG